ncbi:MAG: sigma 54-interacting transcriptional regulator, partial [Gammaproteobacteria bacterium]|nr:sigma 54-interacting transcriptional regulator [Gammaproteobacteria bacterium]
MKQGIDMSEAILTDKQANKERRGTPGELRRLADRDLVVTLNRKLQFQKLFSQISTAFASVAAEQMDGKITHSLGLLAEFLQADRAYLIQISEDSATLRTAHNWYAAGIERDPMVEAGIPLDRFRFVTEQTLSGSDIVVDSLDDLPEDAANEYEYCHSRDIRSFVMIPIFLDGKPIGNFGFDAIRQANRWSPEQVEELHLVSKILATALDRKRQVVIVDERLRFEQLINRLSATFVNLPHNEVHHAIQDALAEVARFMGADFATFIQREPVTGTLYHTHQWVAPGIELDIDFTDVDIRGVAPWLAGQLSQGIPVVISRGNDFPPEAVAERELSNTYGIKSMLWAPFYVSGEIAGYLVLNTMEKDIEWPKALIEELKLIGEIFVNALMRKRSSENLNERLCFESMLSSLSASFINAPNAEVDDKICAALQQIGEYAGVDEAFLFQFRASPTETGITHSWFRSEQVRELSFDADQLLELFPWAAGKLEQQKTIVFGGLDELPVEADAERAYLQGVGLKTSLLIPLFQDNRLRAILFVQGYNEKQWQAHFIDQIHLAAQVFFGALQRKATDQKFQSALIDISELKDQLEAENILLQKEIDTHTVHEEIVGSSPVMKQLVALAEQVAPLDSTVLTLGETGTGKEVLANLVHKLSQRSDRAMVRVNCAALPAALIEAELFGREKGAYTGAASKQIGRFELANGSTIFLDEIGELPLELQAKLLRVLQDGAFERLGSAQTVHVDVRVIAATNQDLRSLVEKGRFREDLYYRLNVFPITVPPLRERRMDIPA